MAVQFDTESEHSQKATAGALCAPELSVQGAVNAPFWDSTAVTAQGNNCC